MRRAGEGVDLISDVAPAGELVRCIGAETEASLQHASELLRKTNHEAGPMWARKG